jgi:hypothetical protein
MSVVLRDLYPLNDDESIMQLYAHILLGSLNPVIFVTHSERSRSLGLVYALKLTTRMISLARRTRPVPSIAGKHRSVTRQSGYFLR